MTKTTEELKREMYRALANLRGRIEINYSVKDMIRGTDEFENEMEDYLEALSQEIEGLKRQGNITLDAYTHQQALTMQARAEADRERNRAQAFEFANQSAGEFLIEASEKVKRQRQSIGQLKNDKHNIQAAANSYQEKYQKARKELAELRKSLGGTSAQSSKENAPELKCEATAQRITCSFEGLHKHYIGACPHCGSGTL